MKRIIFIQTFLSLLFSTVLGVAAYAKSEVKAKADIAVICSASIDLQWEEKEQVKIKTPYGPTSDVITVGKVRGKRVAYMPRHGYKHTYAPHTVPYKANIWAFKQLGVKRIFSIQTVGSLQPNIKPGEFVVIDQFVDRTSGRPATFFDGPDVAHLSAAYPFCSETRELAIKCAKELGITVHEKGTCVVIEGPRFSTCAESQWFTNMGWHVVNMTLYPECILAREQEICYSSVTLVTDYDSGIVAQGNVTPVTHAEVGRVAAENVEKSAKLLLSMIENIPDEQHCGCDHAMDGARL